LDSSLCRRNIGFQPSQQSHRGHEAIWFEIQLDRTIYYVLYYWARDLHASILTRINLRANQNIITQDESQDSCTGMQQFKEGFAT
jgi:hypothetical protein